MIHDAEKLLGGYATGTLTEAERRDLFAAALEHQALFDALADEEALRELLADPAARAELLAALAGAPAPKVLPFWRRHPGALGLAASLLIAVTAGVAYLRTPAPIQQPKAPAAQPPAEAPHPAPAVAAEAAPPPMALPRKERDKRDPPKAGAPMATPQPEPMALAEAPAPLPAPPPPPSPKAKAMEDAEYSRTRAQVAREAMEKKAEHAGMREATGVAAESGFAAGVVAPTARAAGRANQAAPGAPGGMLEQRVVAPSPTWTFETIPEAGRLLRVQHARGQFIYLLRRTPEGPVRIAALPPSGDGTVTRFPLPPQPGTLDLYVLAAPSTSPLSLPAEGPIAGFRARVEAPKP